MARDRHERYKLVQAPRFGPEHFQLLTESVFLVLNKFKTLLSLISPFLMVVFTIMFHNIGIQPTAQAIERS